jgi:hypothetical protein
MAKPSAVTERFADPIVGGDFERCCPTKKIFDKPAAAKLKDAKALNDAGAYLQSNPVGLAVVAAYTDMKGDTEKDRLLTEARSMVARD